MNRNLKGWASENIATDIPVAYKEHISIFVKLLDDENNRVRIETLEMIERVVCIHSKGAIKTILSNI